LVFGNSYSKQAKGDEIERDRLYQKVGKLQVELDWLKKHRAPLMSTEETKQRIQP
jgi:transposase